MRKEIIDSAKVYAKAFNIPLEAGLAFMEIESPGEGFDKKTGKILIQFEPVWFKRQVHFAPSGLWSVNKVDVQSKEWLAFNNAFSINPEAAMKSTSIGLGQIMGLHYKRLKYPDVGAMWDDAKKSLDRQVYQVFKFISTDKNLVRAILNEDWHTVATIYNGRSYMSIAKKYGREPYNISLEKANKKYKSLSL